MRLPLWERVADDAACRSSTRESPMVIRSIDADADASTDSVGPCVGVGMGIGTRGIAAVGDVETMVHASDDDRDDVTVFRSP